MIDVCCGIIVDENGSVLVAQRSERMSLPLKMEFPGGKLEAGESPEKALIRELKEELNIGVEVVYGMEAQEYSYPDFSIRLIPFVCRIISGEIELREHLAFKWLQPELLLECDWAPADIPIVKNYQDKIAQQK